MTPEAGEGAAQRMPGCCCRELRLFALLSRRGCASDTRATWRDSREYHSVSDGAAMPPALRRRSPPPPSARQRGSGGCASSSVSVRPVRSVARKAEAGKERQAAVKQSMLCAQACITATPIANIIIVITDYRFLLPSSVITRPLMPQLK